ncbi:MAG: hypothetical protein NXI32_09225 [bacterium]|nr:hypothetical protein [bacterium]
MNPALRCLHQLPFDHPDRKRPLIGCWFGFNIHPDDWEQVAEDSPIAYLSYNQLGPAWTCAYWFQWNEANPDESA